MEKKRLRKLKLIFKAYPEIVLVYFFGSKAKGKAGPLSDYDLAFYINERDPKKISELQLELIDRLSRLLNTDKIDVVMLNLVESPELKYNIIKEGKLIYEKKDFRVLVEPKILNEYFDFRLSLLKFNLTK